LTSSIKTCKSNYFSEAVKSAAPLARSKANPTIVMQLYQDYQNYQKQAGEMLIKSFSTTHG
jgi:hypothetical protein